MNKLIFIVLTLLSLPAASVLANGKKNNGSIVPEMYLDVICKADSMTFILIDPWSEASENWIDGYGEELSRMTCSDKALCEQSRQLFSNPKSFEQHEMVKNCAFMPDIAIVFHSKKADVTVGYSFYCDVCRFTKGDKYIEFDGELIRKRFLQICAKAYPRDRYVRYLIKKTNSNF